MVRYEMIFEIVDRKALVALEYSIKIVTKSLFNFYLFILENTEQENMKVGDFSFWLINCSKRKCMVAYNITPYHSAQLKIFS